MVTKRKAVQFYGQRLSPVVEDTLMTLSDVKDRITSPPQSWCLWVPWQVARLSINTGKAVLGIKGTPAVTESSTDASPKSPDAKNAGASSVDGAAKETPPSAASSSSTEPPPDYRPDSARSNDTTITWASEIVRMSKEKDRK